MNNRRSTVKAALGFVLALVLIVGAMFGFKVPYEMDEVILEDTNEVVDNADNATEAPTNDNDVEVPVEDDNDTEDGVVEDVPQDSAPTDEKTDDVDNSADVEVAEPTEDNKTATEKGDVENA